MKKLMAFLLSIVLIFSSNTVIMAENQNIVFDISIIHNSQWYMYNEIKMVRQEYTVTNIGNQPTGILTITLDGANSNLFTSTKTTLDCIPVDGFDTFTVEFATGQPEGTYWTSITVSGDNGIEVVNGWSYNVIFHYAAEVHPENHTFTAAEEDYEPQSAHGIIVVNTGFMQFNNLQASLVNGNYFEIYSDLSSTILN
jgi:hypothetical protein